MLVPGWATNCLRDLSESHDGTASNEFPSRIFSDIYHLPQILQCTHYILNEDGGEGTLLELLNSPIQKSRERQACKESKMPAPTSPFAFSHPSELPCPAFMTWVPH